MSTKPSEDSGPEEIIELTDMVEEDEGTETRAEKAFASDEEVVDEASLEEELSDFFAKIEDDAPAPPASATAKPESTDSFDLDELFEDLGNEQQAPSAPREEVPMTSWEDIDLELPGKDEIQTAPLDQESDDFADLDDLFNDLEKGEELSLTTTAEESGIGISAPDLTTVLPPLEEDLSDLSEIDRAIVEPTIAASSSAEVIFPAAGESRIAALEKRLAGISTGLDRAEVTALLDDRLAQALAPDRIPEGWMTVVAERLEATLWPRIEDRLTELRSRLDARSEQDVALTARVDELAAGAVIRNELDGLFESLRQELRQEITAAVPGAAAKVIRQEIDRLSRELGESL